MAGTEARSVFATALGDRRGSVEWAKVIELLAINRLCDPESELGVHQRWYGTTAMDVVLGTEDTVAAKDRLYRALDKAIEHKESLEQHLAGRWQDLFGAKGDLLLYDLTSTYFEGQAGEIPLARRGYSRDHHQLLPSNSRRRFRMEIIFFCVFRFFEMKAERRKDWSARLKLAAILNPG